MTAKLEIRVLGELEVWLDGEPRRLPPSKKTRALLGYLAVTGRRHRRDLLCELLWDVTDDVRGALRWSLSKLRRVVDDPGRRRLLATREHVELSDVDVVVDHRALAPLARATLDDVPLDRLEAAARAFRGALLEGLFLPDFAAFEAWLEAERAEARARHARICRALVERLAGEPGRALEHARAWLRGSGGVEEAQRWIERLTHEPARPVSAPRVAAAAPSREAPGERVVGRDDEPPIAAAAPSREAPSERLVGRDDELARLLLAARQTAGSSRARLVAVLGDPGLGKSALLRALSCGAPAGSRILEGACHEAERSRPFGPLLDGLRERGEVLADPPELLARWTEAGAPERRLEPDAALEAFGALLRRSADEHLFLLLLDDAHFADPSTAEVIHHVVRTGARSPLMVVIAAREAELDDNPPMKDVLRSLRRAKLATEIRLAPLTPEEAGCLVSERTSDPEEVERIVRRGGGNPLFLRELARAPGDAPSTDLAELVLARIEALSEPTRAAIRWASVLERGDVATLRAALAREGVTTVAALENAERYGLLRLAEDAGAPARFEVPHDLLREIVHRSLTPLRRAEMHGIAAELLSERGPEQVMQVARHADRAGRPELAVRAYAAAAEHAACVGGRREAARLAQLGLQHAERLEGRPHLEGKVGLLEILAVVHEPEEDADALATTLQALGDRALDEDLPDLARRAFQIAGVLRWERGDREGADRISRAALAVSRSADPYARALAAANAASCLLILERDVDEAEAMVMEAKAHAARAERPPAELSYALGLLARYRGDHAGARRLLEAARLEGRGATNHGLEIYALEELMLLELEAGTPASVRAAADLLLERLAGYRSGGEAPLARGVLALLEEPRHDEALRGAIEALRALDDKRRQAFLLNRWAARRPRAELEAARAQWSEALALARAVAATNETALAAAGLMLAADAAGDAAAYAEAEETLVELEAQPLSAEARARIRNVTAGAP